MTDRIVRVFSIAGPCLPQGRLTGETAKFWAFSDDRGRPRKLAKAKAHVEPCTRCHDHPQTSYSNGYMD